jgi:hypothetical protein
MNVINEIKEMTGWEQRMITTNISELRGLDTPPADTHKIHRPWMFTAAHSIKEKREFEATDRRKQLHPAYVTDETASKKHRQRNFVKHQYQLWLEQFLGSKSYVFISVNLTPSNLRKAIELAPKNHDGKPSHRFIPLGQQYYESILNGTPVPIAAEELWNKFLPRFSNRMLGDRYKRFGQGLKWVRVYENSGRYYTGEMPTHLHMMLEIPESQLSPNDYLEIYERKFREQFSTLICPLVKTSNCLSYTSTNIEANANHEQKYNHHIRMPAIASVNKPILNIIRARLTGKNAHPKYMTKQLVDWDVATNRLFTGISKNPKNMRLCLTECPTGKQKVPFLTANSS